MELTVNKTRTKHNYEYKIYEENELAFTGKANRKYMPFLNSIYLYDMDGIEIMTLKQEDKFRAVLRVIPLLCFFSFSVLPFVYRDRFSCGGFIREKNNGGGYLFGQINENNYELNEQITPYYSLHCNSKQIALIKRGKCKESGEKQYKILYSKSLEKHLAAAFCMLVDVLWNTSENTLSMYDEDFTIVLSGEKVDTSWVPED